VPRPRAEIFPAYDGGSHFVFMETPTRFNVVLRDDLAEAQAIPASVPSGRTAQKDDDMQPTGLDDTLAKVLGDNLQTATLRVLLLIGAFTAVCGTIAWLVT